MSATPVAAPLQIGRSCRPIMPDSDNGVNRTAILPQMAGLQEDRGAATLAVVIIMLYPSGVQHGISRADVFAPVLTVLMHNGATAEHEISGLAVTNLTPGGNAFWRL